MQGTFEITCCRQPDGTTSIGRQAVSAPWHLSKPYWDGTILLVQAVNVTAGIFAGDHLGFKIRVEPGASALLTSPSASRVHTMPNGGASLHQNLHVCHEGWLEWMPELFIPQKDSHYVQTTEIVIESHGGFYGVETLAPGRVAFGESFAFRHLDWSTRLQVDGKLILSERYPLTPAGSSLQDLTRNGKTRYFANAVLVWHDAVPFRDWQVHVSSRCNENIAAGATMLSPGVYLFRVLTDTSEQLKEYLASLRTLLAGAIPALRQSPRKL